MSPQPGDGWVFTPRAMRDMRRLDRPVQRRVIEALDRLVGDPPVGDVVRLGGARALSLATIDVLEGSGRDLRRHHTDGELAWGWSEEPDESERARDRELRRHAAEKQQPGPGG